MDELFASSGFWFLLAIVSIAMVAVFYEDIKDYMIDKDRVAWRLSKGYLSDEQVVIELKKAKKIFIRKMVIDAVVYYLAFFVIVIGLGLIFFILLFCGGVFNFRPLRWHPWNP